MKIHFVFGGHKPGAEIAYWGDDYLVRLLRTDAVSVSYAPSKATHDEKRQKEESEIMLRSITSDDYVVIFDERGREMTSPEFAQRIERCEIESKRLVVCVGGAYGVTEAVRERASTLVAFSPMIFPHELARIMALEQVYRARSISRGSKYHHGG